MPNRWENCDGEKYCLVMKKERYIKVVVSSIIPFFVGSSIGIFANIIVGCSSRWSEPKFVVFYVLYVCFIICYITVFQVVDTSEYLWLFISLVFTSMWDGMRYMWNRLGLPTWSDIRLIFSTRREIDRNDPKQEISIRDNESNEKRTPSLPPRNRKVVEPAPTTMFQKLHSKVSQVASSSTASEDESKDMSSSLFHRPHCSKHSTPSLESSELRDKTSSKREHFKNMMSKVTNLTAIHKEDMDKQETSGVKVSFSSLTLKSASDREMEEETFSTTEVHQSGAAEQNFVNIVASDEPEPAPTQRLYGIQAQGETSSTVNKQGDLDQTSESSLRWTENQSSAVQDSVRQSPEHPSTSGFAPGIFLWNPTSSPRKLALINARIPKFGTMIRHVKVPLSTLENPAQEQNFADVYSDCQGELWVSGIQCQSSASSNRLPESGSQSQAFNTGCTEENRKCLLQTPASANLQVSLPQTQKRSFVVAFSGSREQSQLSDVKKSKGNQDQAAASYEKLSELEKKLRDSDIRTDMEKSRPEQAPIKDGQTSLHGPVSSVPGIQKMPTFQGQTASTGSQSQKRTSAVQRRRSSKKHTPIPNYRKSPDSETEGPTESTSQLSACGKVGMETFSIQSQQIQASSGGYVPHSVLIRSGATPTQVHVANTSLNIRKEDEDRIRQRSSREPLHLQETDKQETQRK